MKATSIIITLTGIAIMIYCLIYFRPALNAVDSDALTATPHGSMTSEWPLFIGILTTFVGITFFIVAMSPKKSR